MSKYNKGDKVVLRKDLVVGEIYGETEWRDNMKYLAKHLCLSITYDFKDGYYEVTDGWIISEEMIKCSYEESSVEVDTANEDTKYLWMSDEFECGLDSKKEVLFLFKNNRIHLHFVSSDSYKEILKGDYPDVLMTESEAKKHYLFKSVKRVEVKKEELYYVRLNGEKYECVNLDNQDGSYFMSDCDEEAGFKTKFTEEECDKVIGTSEILYKELVK